jgi:NDP-sugar pyrophosphorylase family protein
MNEKMEKIQAILLLDSHSSRFDPFSSNQPEALLPLMGTKKTLIDASLDLLINVNKLKEIILLCSRYIDQIEAHLNRSNFVDSEINIIDCSKSKSLGDTIRALCDTSILTSSVFILMTAASIVSDISLQENIKRHREKRNKAMTILCTPILLEFNANGNGKQLDSISCDSSRRVLKYHIENSPKQKLDILPVGYYIIDIF